jgi:hypothetical protein
MTSLYEAPAKFLRAPKVLADSGSVYSMLDEVADIAGVPERFD